jgi:26S proteasome regulatory subunit N6
MAPSKRIQDIELLTQAKQFEKAISQYKAILSESSTTDDVLKEQENALVHLGELYRELR